ncbi:hypothetical protein ACI2LC_45205 [Nonomuraea wenchangensis]|uniref:hypothetical protein n=1 Tax=Nonomuraea wenchangensis TaxID=568860 RepID=UPI0033E59434
MLTSKARRRLALKTSAMAVLGAGIFGGLPVVAALAAPVDVVYSCTATGEQTATNVPFRMELRTPAAATPSGVVTVTWDIAQPTATESRLPAPSAITPSSTVVAVGTISPSGTPVPATPVTVGQTSTPFATISEGSPMPLATMTMVITPTATGTVALKGGGFALQVNGHPVYHCAPGASGGPSAHFVVTTGSTGTPTGTGTPTNTGTGTPTPTPTTSTPRPTKTTTEIVTVTPSSERSTKKSQTPKSGADTGAGGMMGPDGRTFILAGTALIGAAALGGLLMRRRNATRG